MIQKILRKVHEEEKGFTLIELMVVVLIIGILIAIALPTFLGARNRANDKAAQSSLRNALVAAKTCFTDHDGYRWTSPPYPAAGQCDNAELAKIENSLTFVATGTISNDPNTVSVNVPAAPVDTQWFGAAYSKSGTCFLIKDDQSGAVAPAGGTYYSKFASVNGAGCTGTAAAADPNFSKKGW